MLENGCRIGFFGLGLSNLSLLQLERFKRCKITLRADSGIDRSILPSGLNIERIFEGKQAMCNIDEELLFFSPSVRRDRTELKQAAKRGVTLTSDCELFFAENNAPVFAVTGSDGKSTTATLLHLLLKEAGCNNKLIGNIGEAMYAQLGSAESFVCELSSFMLTYARPKVRRACITNITPNHLDWHKSFEEYRATKLSLLKGAEESVLGDEFKEGYAIISMKKGLDELKKTHRAELFITLKNEYICRNGRPILHFSDIRRKEKHNISNLMMAIAMADGYVDEGCIRNVAGRFDGLAHRCQRVMSKDGVDYYNSSIDSSPARTVSTLESLGRRVVIILGGKGKGLDYSILLPSLKKYVEAVIITGENSHEIFSAIKEINPMIVENFDSAVLEGALLAKGVGALLLSPASTSYDRFKNFAERGEKFKEILSKNI